jgi:hypothetical protein
MSGPIRFWIARQPTFATVGNGSTRVDERPSCRRRAVPGPRPASGAKYHRLDARGPSG